MNDVSVMASSNQSSRPSTNDAAAAPMRTGIHTIRDLLRAGVRMGWIKGGDDTQKNGGVLGSDGHFLCVNFVPKPYLVFAFSYSSRAAGSFSSMAAMRSASHGCVERMVSSLLEPSPLFVKRFQNV